MLAVAITAGSAGSVSAEQNDLVLSKLSYFDVQAGKFKPDQSGFRKLARELGLAFTPKDAGPASTTGEAGFEIGVSTSLNTINPNRYYWKNTTEGGSPSDLFTTMQIELRKGLPYSFELGATVSYLFQSQMYAMGAEVRWAVNEGFYYAPDVMVRAAVNRVMGSRDIDLTTGGVDVVVSKTFGILGTCKLTPYAGYNLALIWAGSRVLNGTPGDSRDDGGSLTNSKLPVDQFAFGNEFIYDNRGLLGLIFNAYFFELAFESVLAANNLYSFTFKLAFNF